MAGMEHDNAANSSENLWVGEVVDADAGCAVRPLLDKDKTAVPLDLVTGNLQEIGSIVVASTTAKNKAAVKQVLADADSTRADVYRLACRHGIGPLYPQPVHREVEALKAAPCIDDSSLEDLERLPFITIDNPDSRDLDQALFIEQLHDGSTVYYALADAAHFVRPGSALFAEALGRGSSYYFPGFAIPMLPRALSEGLISLNQNQLRRALVFVMTLDRKARCRSTRLVQARIRSRRKLSYQRVQRSWDDPSGSSFRGEEFAESLELLRKIGERRIDDARRRHVVDYNRVELQIRTAKNGDFAVSARARLHVEHCNEQISLLCNIEGAKLLERGRGLEHVQPIFRVHPAPGRERLEELQSRIAALVRVLQLDPTTWSWRPEQQLLDDYVRALPHRSRPRTAEAIERQAILTNERSVFGIDPGKHYGIGASIYARFSSPMREIVGIFTHKEAIELLNDARTASPNAADIVLREQVVKAGNRSKALQRTLEKETIQLGLALTGLHWLEAGETTVGSAPENGIVLPDKAAPRVGTVVVDSTGVRWRTDRNLVIATPQRGASFAPIRMGEMATIRLMDHDAKRRRWLFEPMR